MTTGRILIIVDDDAFSRQLREHLVVDGGHTISFMTGSQQGIEAYRHGGFDLVILKHGMFDMPTADVVNDLKKIDSDVVAIVAIDPLQHRAAQELTKLGVFDFVSQPLNLEKFLFIIQKGIQLHMVMNGNRRLTQSLKEQNTSLEKQNILLAKRIEESTKNLTHLYEDLRSTYMHTIKVLAQTIDARDHYTHSHSQNVARYAVAIAEQMDLSAQQVEIIREACELHDLGKIGIEDRILSKPSSLTPEEWEQVRKHPTIAANILEPLAFLDEVIELVRQHHEHYDGTGYPEGRKGEDIILGARIINLADAYDAMTSSRSYRKEPLSKEQAITEIKNNSGKQFDPDVARAFLKIVDKL